MFVMRFVQSLAGFERSMGVLKLYIKLLWVAYTFLERGSVAFINSLKAFMTPKRLKTTSIGYICIFQATIIIHIFKILELSYCRLISFVRQVLSIITEGKEKVRGLLLGIRTLAPEAESQTSDPSPKLFHLPCWDPEVINYRCFYKRCMG